MPQKRLKKEKKLSNVVHQLDNMSTIICKLDQKFPAEKNILSLYKQTLALKKFIINNETEENVDFSQ
jgi:hypothetical protein